MLIIIASVNVFNDNMACKHSLINGHEIQILFWFNIIKSCIMHLLTLTLTNWKKMVNYIKTRVLNSPVLGII